MCGYSAQIAFLPEEKSGIAVLQKSSSNNPIVILVSRGLVMAEKIVHDKP